MIIRPPSHDTCGECWKYKNELTTTSRMMNQAHRNQIRSSLMEEIIPVNEENVHSQTEENVSIEPNNERNPNLDESNTTEKTTRERDDHQELGEGEHAGDQYKNNYVKNTNNDIEDNYNIVLHNNVDKYQCMTVIYWMSQIVNSHLLLLGQKRC